MFIVAVVFPFIGKAFGSIEPFFISGHGATFKPGSINFEKIEGQSIFEFIQNLMGDSALQISDLPYVLFGVKFLELGLREKDRKINERLKIYKAWGK